MLILCFYFIPCFSISAVSLLLLLTDVSYFDPVCCFLGLCCCLLEPLSCQDGETDLKFKSNIKFGLIIFNIHLIRVSLFYFILCYFIYFYFYFLFYFYLFHFYFIFISLLCNFNFLFISS